MVASINPREQGTLRKGECLEIYNVKRGDYVDISNCFYQTLNALGMHGIEFPVFYTARIGIRFDIGDSSGFDVYSKKHTVNPLYIDHCLYRVTQIMDSLPNLPDILAIQLYFMNEHELQKEIKDILSVTKLPYPHETDKNETILDGKPTNVAILLWDLSIINFSKETLLKEVIVSDLGGEHLLTASVFWVWSNSNIMFHLYDDRGADLVAAEKSAIKNVYLRFNQWILKCDRENIESIFED